jgi:predicted lipid-binding transport protein (Tim44 family)
MKKFLIGLVVAASALSVLVPTAEAKRLGGGGSYGKQSQSFSRQQAAPAQPSYSQSQQAQRPATPPAQNMPQQRPSPWKGILGGALLGLGLGALFSHLGIGGAMAGLLGNLLMIALLAVAVMFVVRMFRRKQEGAGPQPAWAGAGDAYQRNGTPEIGSRIEPQSGAAAGAFAGSANDTPYGVPPDFDTAGFLRHAKTYFIRLQAAWDKSDVNDLREFTSPEMFAELKQELLERGAAANHTDVVSLDAQLLGIETTGGDYLASVKFSGMIREAENAAAEPFAEVWNLSKPVAGQGGWVLAGIQQLT